MLVASCCVDGGAKVVGKVCKVIVSKTDEAINAVSFEGHESVLESMAAACKL